ncbi:MAG: hypothetical protein J6D52_04245 [Clostridia bacterium]|nr:hypothetical protein [Clostridia bacterium]
MKKILAIFLAMGFIFLCGCENKHEKIAEEFVLCIAEQRFDDAVALMHPECNVIGDEIASYFAILEKETSIKFKDNFNLQSVKVEKFEDSEATVSGEYTKASGIVIGGSREFTFTLKLVENDNGYGIYKIKFRAK